MGGCAQRWSLPPADAEPLVVGEMTFPLVWRPFLVVGATEPLDDQTRQALAAKGYTVVDLPSRAGRDCAERAGRAVGELTRMERFAPGDLVHARGREWIALPSAEPDWLCLRPLSGAEADALLLDPVLEREPVRPARFDPPEAVRYRDAGRRAAAVRRAAPVAAPRRWAVSRSWTPRLRARAYQLVPLLMALRLPTVRLLVADDVGIGKTIEAGLILRELVDRGEVERFAVLCPPHLVEQWTGELKSKFDLDAVAVTAASAPATGARPDRFRRPCSTPIRSRSSASTTSRATDAARVSRARARPWSSSTRPTLASARIRAGNSASSS